MLAYRNPAPMNFVAAPLRRMLLTAAMAAATGLVAAAPARAQDAALAPNSAPTRVESVVLDAAGADAATLTIRASGRAPDFSLFRLAGPTRIVVDMAGVDVAGLRPPADLAKDGLVSAVTATQFRGQHGAVGRVVVVLRGDAEVEAKKIGDAVVLRMTRTSSAPAQAEPLRAAATRATTAPAPKDQPTVIELSGDEPAAAARASTLLGVAVREQGGGAIVDLSADGAVDRWEIEEIEAGPGGPARIVVDLHGLRVGDGAKRAGLERTFPTTAIAGARIGAKGEATRVVLDLRGPMQRYDVAQTDAGLAIVVDGAREKSAAVDLKGATYEAKGGFWRLKLDVGGPVAVRTVANGPREKVIALDGVRLNGAVPTLQGGPVAAVRLTPTEKAGSVKVALALHDDVEHSVWQKDGAVFWDLRPKSAAPALARADRAQPAAAPFSIGATTMAHEGMTARTYRGKKITIDLMDADIVNVIRLLGDVSGKNVVVGEDVKGRVTLKLKNVPWDQALDVILKTKDLGQETKGGIIRVVPQAKLDAEREARLKLQEEREKKLPTTVRLIPVNYAVANELVPQVEKLLSPRGKATFDARTNVIIVEDIRDNLEQAERLVRTLDTQTPQVLIEARMVEASTQFTRTLGIQWGGSLAFTQALGNPTGLVFPNDVAVFGAADRAGSFVTGIPPLGPQPEALPGFAVNVPAANVNSSLGMTLGSIGNIGVVNARITAAESSGQAKVISSPRVQTLNNKRARISQGVEITIPSVTLNTITFQKVEALLELDVLPHVTADGSILMNVKISNNVPNFEQRTNQIPAVSTKEAESEMLVKDGDTAVIGGIYTRQSGENYEQTPFLGSIPILGWLFKSYQETDNRSEMLVFLTPRIVNRRSATPTGGAL